MSVARMLNIMRFRNVMTLVICLMVVVGVGFFLTEKNWSNSIFPKISFTAVLPNPKKESKEIYRRQSINLTDGKNTFPLSLTRFREEYPYMQDYNCKINFSDPEFCPSKSSSLLLIAANSHPAGFHKRSALRRSWAKRQQIKDYLVITVFMMAMSRDEKLMALVAHESRYYGDIILWDFEEHRANLTLKVSCLLQWLNDDCTSADFFLKVDDDEFVNPEAVMNYITGDENATKFISGNIHRQPMAYRYDTNKVSQNLYPANVYADFPSGGGYLVPRRFVPELYRQSRKLPVFPVDDVFMGFLALAGNISLKHKQQFHMFGLEYKAQRYKEAMVVHSLAADKIIKMWEILERQKL